jgi:hypothetical protein
VPQVVQEQDGEQHRGDDQGRLEAASAPGDEAGDNE